MDGTRTSSSITSAAKSFVDYYDVFGYYKPSLALIILVFLTDWTYGDGLFQRVGQKLAVTLQSDTLRNEQLGHLLLPLGFFLGLLFLIFLFAFLYLVGHAIQSLSQLVDRIFVRALVGYPTEYYWTLFWDPKKRSFREWFYGQSAAKIIVIQLIPVLIVLFSLSFCLFEGYVVIPQNPINVGLALCLFLFIVAPKLHVRRKEANAFSRLAQLLLLLIALILYACALGFSLHSVSWGIFYSLSLSSSVILLAAIHRILSGFIQQGPKQKGKPAKRLADGTKGPDCIGKCLIHILSNHVYFLYNVSKLKEQPEPQVMVLLVEKYKAHLQRYGQPIVTEEIDARGIWWYAYTLVLESSPSAHKLIYHFLAMSGWARALCLTFFMSAIYYLLHPAIFSGGRPFVFLIFMVLLAMSYVFFYRFLYLFIKYYTNFTLRAAAYLPAPAHLPGTNQHPSPPERDRRPMQSMDEQPREGNPHDHPV